MTMKIALYKGRGRLFNRLVRMWTKGPLTHCEVIAVENPDGSATCWSSSYMDGGVRKKTMILNMDNWDIIEVDGDLGAAVAWFEAREGWKYDWLGLLGFVIRPVTGMVNRVFCSQSVLESRGVLEGWRYDVNTMASAFRGLALTKR